MVKELRGVVGMLSEFVAAIILCLALFAALVKDYVDCGLLALLSTMLVYGGHWVAADRKRKGPGL